MTFKDKISKAFEETAEERAEQMLKPNIKHRFSLKYKLRERQMLRSVGNNRTKPRMKKYLMPIVVSLISMLIGATAYAAFLTKERYYLYKNNEFMRLFVENVSSDKKEFEEKYGLPEETGAKLVNYIVTTTGIILEYEYNGVLLCLEQRIIGSTVGVVGTEKSRVETVTVNQNEDGFLIERGENARSLYWVFDGYLFILDGNFTKKEALDLAHSTKIIELPKNLEKYM